MTIALTTDSGRDAVRLRELRRTRAAATGLLVVCLLVLAGARYAERYHPGFAFLAAFAEAAAIGGLADWYAVVALFRRPLGLPIPHTAIVPRNQARIADSLGEFIERHFLADQPVATELRKVDFAAMIADWLADRRQSDDLSRFVLRLLPQALNAMDGSGLRGFLTRRVVERLEAVEIAPLAAGLLDAVTHDRRHQRILDELLVALGQLLSNAEALDAIRDKIRGELPTLFRLFQADGYVLRKLVTSVSSFLEEVRADETHAVRGEFDRFIAGFIDRLRTSPDYAERLDGLRKDLLARPEIRDLAEGIWESVRGFIERETQAPSSMVARRADRSAGRGRRQAARGSLDPRRHQRRHGDGASHLRRQPEERHLALRRRPGEVVAGRPADPHDRAQCRPRSPVHPLQRRADRRPGGACSAHRGGVVAAGVVLPSPGGGRWQREALTDGGCRRRTQESGFDIPHPPFGHLPPPGEGKWTMPARDRERPRASSLRARRASSRPRAAPAGRRWRKRRRGCGPGRNGCP